MVIGDHIGRREIAHRGQRHAVRARIARKQDIKATPFCDAVNFPPFPGLSRWGRASLDAGQPHKVADLKDWDRVPIRAEI